ncbi:MAG: WG repeat-containing protein [Ignavibacteriaceae bacterium]|nr:WG repeat-containing protein [Ignavibacteriaceae bacterium]
MNLIKVILITLLVILNFNIEAQQKAQTVSEKNPAKISFNQLTDFNEGMAAVLKGNVWGFIDENGNVVIEPAYWAVDYPKFMNGLASVIQPDENRLRGYIDKTGKVVIPFQYYTAMPFYDDVTTTYSPASADGSSQIRWSIINKDGKVLVESFPNHHSNETYFVEGLARNQIQFNYGYVDKSGKNVIEPKFVEVRDFSDGMAAVKGETPTGEYKWGFINKDGKLVIDYTYSNEPKPFSNGRTFVLSNDYKWGIIDKEGKLIVEPKFKQVFPYSENLAVVSEYDQKAFFEEWKIIDVNGKVIKSYPKPKKDDERITFWSGFQDGLAIVHKGYGMKHCAVDKTGKEVFKPMYRKINPFNSGRAYAEYFDDKTRKITYGYIDKKGNFVIINTPPQF